MKRRKNLPSVRPERQEHPHRRTRWILGGALVAGSLLAIGGVAGTGLAERLLAPRSNDEPSPASLGVDAAQARYVLWSTTSWGARARLWVGPDLRGRRCLVLQVDQPSATPAGFLGNGGAVCDGGRPRQHDPISVRLSWIPVNDEFAVLATGTVARGITRVAVRSAAGEQPLSLSGGGDFFGELPRTATSGTLSTPSGPYLIVGYDRAGEAVGRLDLERIVQSSRP